MPFPDATRSEAQRIIARYAVARSALLPLLHLVQSVEGHVSEDGIAFCAQQLGLTKAEVGSVATFYSMYKREPFGDYLLSVCTNPTCQIAGGQRILDSFVEACGGHIDRDGSGVMVEHAECLGICDAAPVMSVNYENYGPVTHEQAMDLLARAKAGDPPASELSQHVPATFREVERELSGIDDGVDEQLAEAAKLQATSAVGPSYRSGEVDIAVLHPGGDPMGHGGASFRETSRMPAPVTTADVSGEQRREAAAVVDEVSGVDEELAEHLADPDPVDPAPSVEEQPELDDEQVAASADDQKQEG